MASIGAISVGSFPPAAPAAAGDMRLVVAHPSALFGGPNTQRFCATAPPSESVTAPPSKSVTAPPSESASAATESAAVRAHWEAVRERLGRVELDAEPGFFLGILPGLEGMAEPYVAVVYRGSEACGLVVGRLARKRLVRRVGPVRVRLPAVRSLEVVYGGLVTDGSAEAAEAVAGHLRELRRSGAVDHVAVDYLPVEDPAFGMLAAEASVRGAEAVHWRLELRPGDLDGTMARYSSKHRNTLKRKDRKLAEHFGGAVRLRVFSRPEEMEEFVTGTAGLAARTYQAELGVGFADTPRWRAILATELARGRFRGYWLECRGEPIAYQAGVVHGGVYTLMATSFLPEHRELSPGIVLLMRVIGALCAEGAREIDYGFGDAEYKRTYGTASRMEATLEFWGSSWRARVGRMYDGTVGRGVRMVNGWKMVEGWKRRWRAGR